MANINSRGALSTTGKIVRLFIVLAGFLLMLLMSCKKPTEPTPPPVARINASATSGFAPLVVTFTDESTGEITSRRWEFHDGRTTSDPRATFTYAEPGTYSVSLTVEGPGGSDTEFLNLFVEAAVTLSDLKARIDHSTRIVWLTVDVHLRGYAGRQKVLGLYWLKSCGADLFCYQNTSCNSNAPGNYLGYLGQLRPYDDDENFNDMGFGSPYSCFPDRSPGATYYGLAKLYDRTDINAVTDVNDPTLARLGPPEAIVKITWQ